MYISSDDPKDILEAVERLIQRRGQAILTLTTGPSNLLNLDINEGFFEGIKPQRANIVSPQPAETADGSAKP